MGTMVGDSPLRFIRLATLSLKIMRAIISGTGPDGLSLGKIRTLMTDDWSEQERLLGFAVKGQCSCELG